MDRVANPKDMVTFTRKKALTSRDSKDGMSANCFCHNNLFLKNDFRICLFSIECLKSLVSKLLVSLKEISL